MGGPRWIDDIDFVRGDWTLRAFGVVSLGSAMAAAAAAAASAAFLAASSFSLSSTMWRVRARRAWTSASALTAPDSGIGGRSSLGSMKYSSGDSSWAPNSDVITSLSTGVSGTYMNRLENSVSRTLTQRSRSVSCRAKVSAWSVSASMSARNITTRYSFSAALCLSFFSNSEFHSRFMVCTLSRAIFMRDSRRLTFCCISSFFRVFISSSARV
mmetsp:Transcript_17371/g.40867  ORF Transcript_17371/g.40867 Transcript_17371/m.40867 type:complete len:213 (+) Transcript_17371:709-1347(+)